MKKLLVYLKKYKLECILGPLFKMTEATFELLVPIIMAKMIDNGISNSDIPYIIKLGLVLFLFALIGLTCALTAQYFAAKAAVGFAAKVRYELFSKIQSFSFSELDSLGFSTLLTRMTSDINQVQTGVNLAIRLLLRSPFIVFGAMITAFFIDVKSAFIFTVLIPLLSLVVFGIMLITIPLYKKVQNKLDDILSSTNQNLSGVRVLRAFNRQKDEKLKFRRSNSALTDFQNYVGKMSGLMNPLTFVIVNAALIVLLYTGALQVDGGRITQGQVVALVNLMSQILVELVKLANLIITLTKSIASGNRIQAILDEQTNMENGNAPIKSINEIKFESVSFRYAKASEESLYDISFEAKKGEKIGIIGGTGSGKTSLVNLIPRFYDTEKGQVLINGKNIKEYDYTQLRKKIGVIPQNAQLFNGTVRDNIKWGDPDCSDEEIMKSLSDAQAKEFVLEKDGALDYVISQNGTNLSGGQKQRLTIARALVKRPDVLILDDSSSALDFATDAALRKAVFSLSFSPLTFIVSQRASGVMNCDKIIVLDDGHIVGIGKHHELLENCDVYKEIYQSQYETEAKTK